MRKTLVFLILGIVSLLPCNADAQGSKSPEKGIVEFEEKIHDFGDVLESDGKLKYTFTFTNISTSPVVIHNVVSSCGCTTPDWSQKPIPPSEKGYINVVFKNDQGPYPFDKTLTVYLSGVNKPVVLRIRGTVHESKGDITKMYNKNKIGNLGFKKKEYSIGYIEQGIMRQDKIEVANLSNSPLKVEQLSADNGLSVTISPNPIPAKRTAILTYTVNPNKFSKTTWGKISLNVSFKIAGKTYPKEKLTITGSVVDDFSKMTQAEKDKAPVIEVEKTYVDFGTVAAGNNLHCSFVIKNTGKKDLIIHDIKAESAGVVFNDTYPMTIKPSEKKTIKLDFKTSGLRGEIINILTVVTNSPERPIMNLFLTGTVE